MGGGGAVLNRKTHYSDDLCFDDLRFAQSFFFSVWLTLMLAAETSGVVRCALFTVLVVYMMHYYIYNKLI